MFLISIISTIILINYSSANEILDLNLPSEHIPQYFFNFPNIRKECEDSSDCPYKEYINVTSCWGYEFGCTDQNVLSKPSCPGDHRGWVKDKKTQIETFRYQGDFGEENLFINNINMILYFMFKMHFIFCRICKGAAR